MNNHDDKEQYLIFIKILADILGDDVNKGMEEVAS